MPPTPWLTEPTREEFQHAGLPCLLNRGPLGVWCGYSAVPPGHPLHGVGYSTPSPVLASLWEARQRRPLGKMSALTVLLLACKDVVDRSTPEAVIDVHGGLTYSDRCQGVICHTPAPGESDDVWWFGFDCGHAGDLRPGSLYVHEGDVYRTIDYAREETKRLAEQLAAVGV